MVVLAKCIITASGCRDFNPGPLDPQSSFSFRGCPVVTSESRSEDLHSPDGGTLGRSSCYHRPSRVCQRVVNRIWHRHPNKGLNAVLRPRRPQPLDQFTGVDPQSPSQLENVMKGQVPSSAFYLADEGPMQAGVECQTLLALAELLPSGAHSCTELCCCFRNPLRHGGQPSTS